jgi:hypothetical protein
MLAGSIVKNRVLQWLPAYRTTAGSISGVSGERMVSLFDKRSGEKLQTVWTVGGAYKFEWLEGPPRTYFIIGFDVAGDWNPESIDKTIGLELMP